MIKSMMAAMLAAFFMVSANATPGMHYKHMKPSVLVSPEAKSKANIGDISGDVDVKNEFDQEKPAASPSSAASSNTTAPCRYLDQKASSIVIINGSYTKMLRDLVCTLEKPLNAMQMLALCDESGAYRKIRYYLSTVTKEGIYSKACPIGGAVTESRNGLIPGH